MADANFTDLDVKQQIKSSVDIVELVGDYIPLRREGRAYKGICPWHDDSRPSLTVNPERQSWRCWVCAIGGDIFTFLMKREGVEFREALEILARKAGIQLSGKRAKGPTTDAKSQLYQAVAWAAEQYHQFLLTAPEAEPARQYIAKRQISADSIRKYQLGFSPPTWDWLVKRARATTFSPQVLETVDLAARRTSGPGHFDRFRGRWMFPIRDLQGRPVAFGGRVIPGIGKEDDAKYLNSRETPLFTKSQLLYGLHDARDAVTRSRTALVMEGYTDCIVAQQCGFPEAVAVLGTALGERHIKLLRPLCDRVVLVLDGDKAGQTRTNEVLELFLAENVDLAVASPPPGLDPADFLLQTSAEEFRQMLSQARDALTHAFQAFTQDIDPNDIHQMSQALERILAIVAKAPRLREDTTTAVRLREEKTLERLAFLFRISELEIRNRLSELRRKTKWKSSASISAPTTTSPASLDAWERHLLELLLQAPNDVGPALVDIADGDLRSAVARTIINECRRLLAQGTAPDFERLMLQFEDPNVQQILVELDESGRTRPPRDALADARQIIDRFRHRREERDHSTLRRSLADENADTAAQQALLERLIQHKRQRQGISSPTEG